MKILLSLNERDNDCDYSALHSEGVVERQTSLGDDLAASPADTTITRRLSAVFEEIEENKKDLVR